MKKHLFIYFTTIVIVFASKNEPVHELIRRKLEVSHFNGLHAFNEPLYCVKSLTQFYIKQEFKSVWTKATALQLIAEIEQAYQEGLNPSDYHIDMIKNKLNDQHTTSIYKAEYDLLLSDAFLLYASHLLSGKVNPQTIHSEWYVTRREGNPIALLERAFAEGSIKASIQSAIPKLPIYQNMKLALKDLHQLKSIPLALIPTSNVPIKKGMSDKRIPEIRERLHLFKYFPNKYLANETYDEVLHKAILEFQKNNGLEATGVIGEATIAALNIPISQRINQLEVNMERWRWPPQEFGSYYIKVNIANFELDVVKDHQIIRSHKIVVGKPYRRTPVFNSKMQYLVLNPTWTVPPGILNADILPSLQKDPSYLQKKNLQVLDHNGNLINTDQIDWKSPKARSYIYRQPPGPTNALGAVKFMFPNNFHVYLHDTPSKELFDKTERAYSSGCIRVQNPLALAEFLINDHKNWNTEKINTVISTRKSLTILLKEQPNIYLIYCTAWVDTKNNIQFRKDIYERDTLLLNALKEKPPMQ
mgnify:CR=1 FL=1